MYFCFKFEVINFTEIKFKLLLQKCFKMDLKKFDLNRLSILWFTSQNNQDLLDEIEVEIKEHITKNKIYSKEFIFQRSKILNRSLGVFFIPSSESYQMFGDHVIIDMLLNEDELFDISKNISSVPPKVTYGLIRAKVLFNNSLNNEKIEILAKVGFNTKDILRIEEKN
jgi:hypothetical protein